MPKILPNQYNYCCRFFIGNNTTCFNNLIAVFFAFVGLLLFIGSTFNARASHGLAMDIAYTCLGPDTYEIELNFYRDCGGSPAPLNIQIDATPISCPGANSFKIPLKLATTTEVSALCPAYIAQSTCNGGSYEGIEQYQYKGLVTFEQACAQWQLFYNLCCRSFEVTNLQNPGDQDINATAIINNANGLCNSSPKFTYLPFAYLCGNQAFTYNNGAIDAEGDSLVFELINPQNVQGVPIGYTSVLSATYPLHTLPAYNFGFSGNNGQFSFTPDGNQNASATLLVTQYNKSGQKIGAIMRQLQFIIFDQNDPNCANVAPTISGGVQNVTGATETGINQLSLCPNTPMSFTLSITDPNISNQLSITHNAAQATPGAILTVTGTNPATINFSYTPTKADIGTHLLTIEANDGNCAFPAKQTFSVLIEVLDATYAGPDLGYCPAGGPLTVEVTGGSNFTWSPMAGVTFLQPNGSVVSLAPNATTTYTITSDLTNGCSNTDQITVSVVADFNMPLNPESHICLYDTSQIFTNLDPALYAIIWYPAYKISDIFDPNPFVYPDKSMNYTITASHKITGCTISKTTAVILDGILQNANFCLADSVVCISETTTAQVIMKPFACGLSTTGCDATAPSGIYEINKGFDKTGITTPFRGIYEDARTQYLIKPDKKTMSCMGNTVTSVGFNVTAVFSKNPYENFTISMGCRSPKLGNPVDFETGLIIVYTAAQYTPTAGWNTFTLPTPYDWDGVSDLVLEVCYDNQTGNAPGGVDNVYLLNPTPLTPKKVVYANGNNSSGCYLNDATTTNAMPYIQLGLCGAAPQPGTVFTWSPAAFVDATDPLNPEFFPTQTTTYTLSIDHQGCVYQKNQTISVGSAQKPQIPSSFLGDYCAEQEPNLLVQGGLPGGAKFVWFNHPLGAPDHIIKTGQAYNPKYFGDIAYWIGVQDANGCIGELIQLPVNLHDFSIIPGPMYCFNGQIFVNISVMGEVGESYYITNNGDGKSSKAKIFNGEWFMLSGLKPGDTYDISIKAINTGCIKDFTGEVGNCSEYVAAVCGYPVIVSEGGLSNEQNPDIWGNNIVWQAGNPAQIYHFNLADPNQTQNLMSAAAAQGNVNPILYDSIVVWQANYSATSADIFFNNINTPIAGGVNMSNSAGTINANPDIYRNIAVWEGQESAGSTNYDIYLFDTNKPGNPAVNISNNANKNDRRPLIWGNYIIWAGEVSSNNYDLFMYDHTNAGVGALNITYNPQADVWPLSFEEHYFVFQTTAGLWYYNLLDAKPSPVLFANLTNTSPQASGLVQNDLQMVWADDIGSGQYGLFYYDFANPIFGGSLLLTTDTDPRPLSLQGNYLTYTNNNTVQVYDLAATTTTNPAENAPLGNNAQPAQYGHWVVWAQPGQAIYAYDLTLPVPPPPQPDAANTINYVCPNNTTFLAVLPPLPGFTLNWYSDSTLTNLINNSGVTQQTIPNLTNDTTLYAAIQDTLTGCLSEVLPLTATVNTLQIDLQTATDITNCGLTDGSITITASGGNGSYQFSINGGATWQTSGNFVGLGAGSYPILVTDGMCSITGQTLIITAPNAPGAPTLNGANNVTYCQNEAIQTLTGSANSGGTLTWYADAGLTTVVASGNSFTPPSILGTTTYYLVETLGNCISTPASVSVTIYELPMFTAQANDLANCNNTPDGSIIITPNGGNGNYQYSIDGGNTWQALNSFTNLAAGDYAVLVKDDFCTAETIQNLTINAPTKPNMPTPSIAMAVYCQGDVIAPITVSGSGGVFNWYADAALTNLITSGNSFTPPPTPGTTIYYVTENDGLCASNAATVSVTINALPPAPQLLITNVEYCLGDPILPLTASGSGGSLNWYADAALSNLIASGNSYTPASTIGTTIYYVAETVNNCQGSAAQATVVVHDLPQIANIAPTNATTCLATDGSLTITGSGGSGNYEYSIDGGLTWQASNIFTDLSKGNYAVMVKDEFCQTGIVPAGINAPDAPLMPTINGDANFTICDGAELPTFFVDLPLGGLVNWYNDPLLTTSLGTGLSFKPLVVQTGDNLYFATNTANGCESLPALFLLVVTPLPDPPLLPPDTTICQGQPMPALVATPNKNGLLQWYSDSDLSNPLAAGNNFTPPTIAPNTTATYYVTETVDGCQGNAGIVKISVSALPPSPALGPDAVYCITDLLAPLTATPLPNAIINWYGNAGLTNLLATNQETFLPTITNPEIGQTFSFYATQTIDGCEGSASVVKISFKDCSLPPPPPPLAVTIPTAFSPNDDGINDVFRPKVNTALPLQQFRLAVYDRWGNRVFDSTNPNDGWNGLLAGNGFRPAPVGVYVFMFMYENEAGQLIQTNGNITLLR
ncbi:MAG: gliding motility-associated C-terminal domain-containing protein [Sphingobacteriales bacterium]|jgi:gliding motility-associated-like protein|nr:gliding motility-associated C-terminal domain-containing protein [Sphingobacteriales bacterium]MBP9140528.1 gliding motility-associated C-terminal domain-containing protein [Chitinophagales bacterium]MDA0197291.1 gliding motility-associated C-terminal domain-containing protein [Bacteroidota bacterium]MBK6890402.1 gliding motility-associated C-terminal domain-containing protein [Sphingobacteriales bacterium]MBK7526543.1 gliding motility-associated C-terminal domain-containing protein [Sphingo